jgi:hypothetical protein
VSVFLCACGCGLPLIEPIRRRKYRSDACARRAATAKAGAKRDAARAASGRPKSNYVVRTVAVGVDRECDNPACAVVYRPTHHRQTYHSTTCRVSAANVRAEGSPSARGTIERLRTYIRLLRVDYGVTTAALRAENRRLAGLVVAAEADLAAARDTVGSLRAELAAARRAAEGAHAAGVAVGRKSAAARKPFSLTGTGPLVVRPTVRPNTVVEPVASEYAGGSSIGGNWNY